MEKESSLSKIIEQVENIRDFFQSGDEIIPFIGDLFSFLRDLMPLMTEINVSLQEGTNNLPVASNRISDVTQTTEMAANEIMDKLDTISTKLSGIAERSDPGEQKEIETIIDNVTDINMALQFQDITSQKLEHANRILGAIYDKFINLIKSAQSMKNNSSIGSNLLNEILTSSHGLRSTENNDEFKSRVEDTIRHEEISQDDIDQMFKS